MDFFPFHADFNFSDWRGVGDALKARRLRENSTGKNNFEKCEAVGNFYFPSIELKPEGRSDKRNGAIAEWSAKRSKLALYALAQ
ncbi:MAG: hypothetical protein E6Q77_06535 [Rhizobium sp.]|nr:MAG: hypothetical protein E6Q77_06535 [Rhizobium sp.]